MKIRTITAGIDLDPSVMGEQIEDAGRFLSSAREAFTDSGITVQTVRLSTQPWGEYSGSGEMVDFIAMAVEMEKLARAAGIDYISIGPSFSPNGISLLPQLFRETTFTCASAFIGDAKTGPIEENIRSAARAVMETSSVAPDGSRNFMFASCACCPADIPFFPAGYHGAGEPSFTIGLENGDVVFEAAERASNLHEFRKLLVHSYSFGLDAVESICTKLERKHDRNFRGTDVSIVPGLGRENSVALSIERVTGSPFGSHGTLSAAAAITSSLSDIKVKKCGYSGLMLPVMEDDGLAAWADMGSMDLQKLLLYSSVCGTGLDAVPVPGDTSLERISGVLMDVAYLAVKWNKPLSARLLPIPGRASGEMTEIPSPHLRNCSIIPVI